MKSWNRVVVVGVSSAPKTTWLEKQKTEPTREMIELHFRFRRFNQHSVFNRLLATRTWTKFQGDLEIERSLTVCQCLCNHMASALCECDMCSAQMWRCTGCVGGAANRSGPLISHRRTISYVDLSVTDTCFTVVMATNHKTRIFLPLLHFGLSTHALSTGTSQ